MSTQTRPEGGCPFAHCVNHVIPLQDHVLQAPHFGRGGMIPAGKASGLCSIEAGTASSRQREESVVKSRATSGVGVEAFASPARDEAGRERRSSRAREQLEVLIACDLLFAG